MCILSRDARVFEMVQVYIYVRNKPEIPTLHRTEEIPIWVVIFEKFFSYIFFLFFFFFNYVN